MDLRKSAVGLRDDLKLSQEAAQQVLVTNRAAARLCIHFAARADAGGCCVAVSRWIGRACGESIWFGFSAQFLRRIQLWIFIPHRKHGSRSAVVL